MGVHQLCLGLLGPELRGCLSLLQPFVLLLLSGGLKSFVNIIIWVSMEEVECGGAGEGLVLNIPCF